MRAFTLLSLCFVFIPVIFLGQGGFHNVSSLQGIDAVNINPVWGAGVSFYDFDNDGWDDLSFAMNNDSLKFYKNVNGNFQAQPSFGENSGDAKHICWFDMDNDGDSDVIITYYYAQTRLYRNEGNWNFTDITEDAGIPSSPIAKSFGVCCGDYDKDGFLDVYITNYNWFSGPTNWLLHNNGDGTFQECAQQLGVDNGMAPSFQATWMDYNNDGWPDLYVINDKAPANALYKNNGDGTFTDVSESSGTDVVVDAMSNAICDYNNDGFLDIYITNSSSGNFLLMNNGDETFTNTTEEAGLLVYALSWGTLWLDYDNDMDDDAHVLTTYIPINYRNYMYENQNDGTFIDVSEEAGIYQDGTLSYANAKGDFDNDGFFDMAMSNSQPATCYLYQNDGGENHYLKIDLEGLISNRDAVGTWLDYYLSADKYVEFTMCGENYMGQDSHSEILAMGENTMMDSLLITWPSGLIEKYYNLEADQSISIVEGASLSNAILYSGENIICVGDSTIIDAGEFSSYLWSDGDTSRYKTIFETGTFSVNVINEFGFSIPSDTLVFTQVEAAEYELNINHIACFGDSSGTIAISQAGEISLNSIAWETGDSSMIVSDLPIGDYWFTIIDENDCLIESYATITQADLLEITVETDNGNGIENGSCSVVINGGTPPYSISWSNGGQEDEVDDLDVGDYWVQVLDSLLCSSSMEFTIDYVEGIDYINNENTFLIYPNPCRDILSISMNEKGENLKITISDLQGKMGYSKQVNGQENLQIDIHKLSSGTYILQVLNEDLVLYREILVKE